MTHSTSDSPYVLLIIGVVALCIALAGMATGKALGRFGVVVDRSTDSKGFWQLISTWYLVAVCLSCTSFSKIQGASN